jgi:hypothetical protein
VVRRLPVSELDSRLDVREVTAEFHQVEVLAWLFREGTAIEQALLLGVGFKWHIADAGKADRRRLPAVVDPHTAMWHLVEHRKASSGMAVGALARTA